MEDFVEKRYKAVCWARGRGLVEEDIEDFAQEVLLRGLRGNGQVNYTYVYIDYLRYKLGTARKGYGHERSSAIHTPNYDTLIDTKHTPDTALFYKREIQELNNLLTPRQRTIIDFAEAGYRQATIARELGVSESTLSQEMKTIRQKALKIDFSFRHI